LILKSGANKYHIKPRPIDPTHIFRGSCTGNPPTIRGYNAAKKLFETKLNGVEGEELETTIRDIFEDQRSRISELLDLPDGSSVILCPSGSDAEYIPVAIASSLRERNVKITNGVTQLNEIGAGSAPASVGKYFSKYAPLVGKLPDEAEILQGFEGIDGNVIPARTRDGNVINASQKMKEFLNESLEKGYYPIVHGVFGGKTGVRDDEMPPSLDGGKKSLGVVDACQGRFTLEELHGWLNNDSLVLFTCSKFYQAPPFCACVIVPPSITKELSSSAAPTQMLGINGLGSFLTDKELPSCLQSWNQHLHQNDANNIGLALRTEAGLAGMEAISSISEKVKDEAVEEWANLVTQMVKNESCLDPWAIERSIISIRVANPNGGWLDMSQARDLYRWMSLDVSDAVPGATLEEKNSLSKPAYIGQPVDVSQTHAIVRIALGVESLLSYLNDKEGTLQEDQFAVKKLAAISKYFDTLKNTGL